jgi:7-cyano-7-deazaguanine synthase
LIQLSLHPAPDSGVGVLVSGGLDSSILVASLLERGAIVQPLYVRSHLIWEPSELRAAERFLGAIPRPGLRDLVVLELPLGDVYGDHWSITGQQVPAAGSPDEAVFLPGRNALLIVKAAVWCQLNGIGALALASLGSNPFADASHGHFEALETVFRYTALTPLSIQTPFQQLTKRQVMTLGRCLPLELTLSCLLPVEGQHCGRCNKCAERRAAFTDAHLPDPTSYAHAMAVV